MSPAGALSSGPASSGAAGPGVRLQAALGPGAARARPQVGDRLGWTDSAACAGRRHDSGCWWVARWGLSPGSVGAGGPAGLLSPARGVERREGGGLRPAGGGVSGEVVQDQREVGGERLDVSVGDACLRESGVRLSRHQRALHF